LNISNAVQGKLSFTTINDYGGRVETELKLN